MTRPTIWSLDWVKTLHHKATKYLPCIVYAHLLRFRKKCLQESHMQSLLFPPQTWTCTKLPARRSVHGFCDTLHILQHTLVMVHLMNPLLEVVTGPSAIATLCPDRIGNASCWPSVTRSTETSPDKNVMFNSMFKVDIRPNSFVFDLLVISISFKFVQ